MTAHGGTGGHSGRSGFAARHGLSNADRQRLCDDIGQRIEREGLHSIRLAFADQHGVLRGKTLMVPAAISALTDGCAMTSTLLLKDTSHRTVFPVWQPGAGVGNPLLEGACDFIMLPDPETFHVLPWVEGTGWMLCDIYMPDGEPVPYSTRRILKDSVAKLDERGWSCRTGLELEFHILAITDQNLRPEQTGQPATPPSVSLTTHGFQYLTEVRADQLQPVTDLLRNTCEGLDLPLRSIETEFGPSQVEFTFDPAGAVETADTMMLFKSAAKQVCRRQGLHATFMCRPQVPGLFSSGWHLHQSIADGEGNSLFMPQAEGDHLSVPGMNYLAGLLEHAAQSMILAAPTLNGYKRYRPHTLAPDRINWGLDNKGAMLRVIGGAGEPGTRIENRIAEPSANPYLFIAGQIMAGLDGLERALDPVEPSHSPYSDNAPAVPANLIQAVDLFRGSRFFRGHLGDRFVDYLCAIKQAEIDRFLSEVTDWDQREYFDIF